MHDEYLRKLVRNFNNKEKYSLYDCDIENLFDEVSVEDYYKPILVKSPFKSNDKYYESRGDKEKGLSVNNILTR